MMIVTVVLVLFSRKSNSRGKSFNTWLLKVFRSMSLSLAIFLCSIWSFFSPLVFLRTLLCLHQLCLDRDPRKRPTTKQLLEHPFLSQKPIMSSFKKPETQMSSSSVSPSSDSSSQVKKSIMSQLDTLTPGRIKQLSRVSSVLSSIWKDVPWKREQFLVICISLVSPLNCRGKWLKLTTIFFFFFLVSWIMFTVYAELDWQVVYFSVTFCVDKNIPRQS
jgi:serine/threonine protein kinase